MTQVLSDGTDTYLYGLSRSGEQAGSDWEYYLDDALRSVRQLVDNTGAISLAKTYQPYGELMSSYGDAASNYGFTGEMSDPNGLIYLRSRYLDPSVGRFLTKDVWQGDNMQPLSLNRWGYVEGNPVMRVDPSGMYTYNRQKAVQYAMNWDHQVGIDPTFDFVSQVNPDIEGNPAYSKDKLGLQCTMFASSVLYTGGVRDLRQGNNSIWDYQYLMDGSEYLDPDLRSWYNTPKFYNFVTSQDAGVGEVVFSYNNPPQFKDKGDFLSQADINWRTALQANRSLIREGDLVFYDRIGGVEWDHVAVIVGWGYPTTYAEKIGGYTLHVGEDSYDVDISPMGGTEPAIYQQQMIEAMRCGNLERYILNLTKVNLSRPLVVERSGGIDYVSWRSLDNTATEQQRIHIVHLNDTHE